VTLLLADQRGQRIQRGTAATITFVNVDQDGTAATPPGAVTVGVTRGDGTVVVAAGTATTTTGNVSTLALAPAQTAVLDLLTATWTVATAGAYTTQHEVVGGYYISLADLRWQTNLGDDAKFPDSRLIDARRWFEDLFEEFTGVAWVPRYRRATVTAPRYDSSMYPTWGATGNVVLPDMYLRTIRSLSYTSFSGATVAFTSTEVADLTYNDAGLVSRRSFAYWPPLNAMSMTLAYEYGHDSPPRDVWQASKMAIADRVTSDNSGNRQYSVSTAAGIVRTSTPGPNTPFGIPFVDEVANRRRERSHNAG